jgi:hypothetical protein
MTTRRRVSIDDALCFLIPLALPLQVTLIGRLYLSEIVLLILLPVLIARRGHILRESRPFAIILLGVVWLAALVLTDVVRGTAFVDYSRGWAKVCFTILNFVAIFMLVNHHIHRIGLAFLGWGIGVGVVALTNPELEDVVWKFGGGDSVVFTVLSFIAIAGINFKWSRNIALVTFAIIAVLSVGPDARNLGGRALIAFVLCFVQPYVRPQFVTIRKFAKSLAVIAVVVLVTSYSVLSLYGLLASKGFLSEEATSKYEMQRLTDLGPYGLVLGGRPEALIAVQAILDRPILGHGSWARSYYYYAKYLELAQLGFDISQFNLDDTDALWEQKEGEPFIPSHSILFNTWVEGGIAAGMLWIYVLFLTLYAIVVTIHGRSPISPLIFYVLLLLTWNIFFSPFGAERRLECGMMITLVLVVLRNFAQTSFAAAANPTLRSNPLGKLPTVVGRT